MMPFCYALFRPVRCNFWRGGGGQGSNFGLRGPKFSDSACPDFIQKSILRYNPPTNTMDRNRRKFVEQCSESCDLEKK